MSRQNKVNPDRYTLAGRLTPDDLAREYRKQSESGMGSGRARSRKATPPWMANNTATDNTGAQFGAGADPGDEDRDQQPTGESGEDAQERQGKARRNAKGKSAASASGTRTGNRIQAEKKTARRTKDAGRQTRPAPTPGGATKKRATAKASAGKKGARKAGAVKRGATNRGAATSGLVQKTAARNRAAKNSAVKKRGVTRPAKTAAQASAARRGATKAKGKR